MISKHIERLPENDNYKDLADYIRDARISTLAAYIADLDHDGEKVLYRWHDGCLADDYSLAVREVQATQNLNTRSRKEKTYHLLVSFRPEDEDKLTGEMFREIEREFAEKLGFGEHQRHCGVHKNTKNLHLHVAYNMIHPVKLTRHEPYRDYAARDQLCRELERRLGLIVDNGITSPEPQRKNDKARTVEAHTGQQSFDGYVRERGEVLVRALGNCASWPEVHLVLARYGLEIQVRANGCVIADRHGKHRIKASSLDRGISKPALEARLGPFEPCMLAVEQVASLERERYTARPLQRGPERGDLYREYRAGIEKRKRRLEDIRQEKAAREEQIRKYWREKRRQAESVSCLLPGDRIALLRTYGTHERTALEKCRAGLEERRREVRAAVIPHGWNFLRAKPGEATRQPWPSCVPEVRKSSPRVGSRPWIPS